MSEELKPLRGRDLTDWTELGDDFHHNPKELNAAFTVHCSVMGYFNLRFPADFVMPAIMVEEFKPEEIRETVEFSISMGWLKFPAGGGNLNKSNLKTASRAYRPGYAFHKYDRLGFCERCGIKRTRAVRMKISNRPASPSMNRIIDANWDHPVDRVQTS